MNLNDLFNEEKVRLDPKCWTGKKIGNPKTKMKGGVRVNNCVPAESVAEGSLEEVSQDTARSYAQKARVSQKDLINQTHRKGADTDKLNKKIQNRQQGLNRAHTDKRYYKDEQGVAEEQELDKKWSQKYKSSINCANPKGFSQRAHCAGRKKNEDVAEGVMYGAENLNVGDDVIVSGDVELNGATGVIDSFGQDKRFVVVDLYNHGKHSFHSSDVSANDYDNDEHDDSMAEGALDDSNFGKSAALMTPSPQAAQQAKDIVQKQADANVISQAKIAGAAPVTREGEQQKGADYRDPKEVDYDDEYDAMVARVKKLAGLGPMRTVYDPTKRQYRNMPTAVQPKK